MGVNIDENLRNVLHRVYEAITENGGEASVCSPAYTRTEIDALIQKGLVQKIDASTLSGWAYILRPTYDGEKALKEVVNPLRTKVEDLILRGEEIGIKEIHTSEGTNSNTTISGYLYDKWMGEINIFNERHLKNHPLYNSIHSTYFHRQSRTSYDDMMGHLRALDADEEFLGKKNIDNGEEKVMGNNAIAQMLSEDINRCKAFLEDPNDEVNGKNIYEVITGRYDSIIPDFGNGLYQYFADQHFYDPDISGESLTYNLKKLMLRMESFLAMNYPSITASKSTNAIAKNDSRERGNMSNKVFIVHGHDNEAKQEMARTLEKAGFEAIILHEQPDGGRTIIEKIERYTDVAFAVVLYTECDLGRAKEDDVQCEKYRARQNVVFEHGYLIGKLGRSSVCALVKGNVETPGDISGVVYTPMDVNGAWKIQLGNNMKDAGIDVDLNKLCR